jgi:hypothetical protein
MDILNENVYEIYERESDKPKDRLPEKIINYYIEKIRRDGMESLTQKEKEIYNDARRGVVRYEDKPIYKRSKVTGEIEYDNKGNPIRTDKPLIIPGVPFLTPKGKGLKRKEIINGRCYMNDGSENRNYYVFDKGGRLIKYKTISDSGKPMGTFMGLLKKEDGVYPEQLWDILDQKFDSVILLDKTMYETFLSFDYLYHNQKKDEYQQLMLLYRELAKYKGKKG